MPTSKLAHLWEEYADTLHPQTAPDELGQERVVRWRSTVPAEAFFNVETLIAVELRTEYFKHQPGILTGIGIIGTFAGLLRGLYSFSVSSDPEVVRANLDKLIHGVVEAFAVSATAIFLAMVTTFLEKTLVTGRIKQVEELCHLIDSLFEGGAGEEYLSRLVKASESSATQTAQLKDALVADLKEMLADMTRQQSEAIAASFREITQSHVAAITESSRVQVATTEQSGDRIAQAIAETLSEPLQTISAAVHSTSDTNGQVVTRALNEALVAFSQKLEDMFGGQMRNMNQLLLQTTSSMQAAVARFDQLADNLGQAGKSAADAMSERLSLALESMEARQHALNTTMSEFVSQLRDMVQSSQSKTNTQLEQTLTLIGEKVAAMTAQIEEQARLASQTHHDHQDRLAQNASQLAAELGQQVQSSMAAMQQQLGGVLGVLKDYSTQTASATVEQQKCLAQNTQNAVESLSSRVESTVATLDQKMTGFLDLLSKQTEQTSSAHLTTQQHLADQANRLIEQLGQQVQAMTVRTQSAVDAMQASVAALRDVTQDATRRLDGSANTLSLAADNFAKAGNSVNGVILQAGQASDKLATTAVALSQAASTVQTALTDYDQASKALAHMVGELKSIVATAKQEASVSQSLVAQIKQSAEHLQQAQSQVDGIFQQVCNALADAHEAFAQNVENSLRRGNAAYQKELKDAVDYLKTAIEELGEVAEKIPAVAVRR